MANIAGVLAPAEQDGITFTIATANASAVKTFWPNAIVAISVGVSAGALTAPAGVTVTFGQINAGPLGGTGHAPTTPSATNGFFLPAGAPAQLFWLGSQRDSLQFFNNTGQSVTVGIQPMSVL